MSEIKDRATAAAAHAGTAIPLTPIQLQAGILFAVNPENVTPRVIPSATVNEFTFLTDNSTDGIKISLNLNLKGGEIKKGVFTKTKDELKELGYIPFDNVGALTLKLDNVENELTYDTTDTIDATGASVKALIVTLKMKVTGGKIGGAGL